MEEAGEMETIVWPAMQFKQWTFEQGSFWFIASSLYFFLQDFNMQSSQVALRKNNAGIIAELSLVNTCYKILRELKILAQILKFLFPYK